MTMNFDINESYIIRSDFPQIESIERMHVGGKARSLARLALSGAQIPDWVVVTPAAFYTSLSNPQRQVWEAARTRAKSRNGEFAGGDVTVLLDGLHLNDSVWRAVEAALAELVPDGKLVAVRSSAVDEDGVAHSFAGQLESYLNVAAKDVPARIVDVWRSGFSPRLIAYRAEHDLDPVPHPPAVLIQRMVQADMAGVAFSADPVSGRRRIAVVAATRGLGDALVAGEADADTYHVEPDGTVVKEQLQAAGESVLHREQAAEIATLARTVARHFQRPQDIEWAIEGEQLYLLQARPITSLATLPDPDGLYTLWDNSNIIESYGGMTTPLTYSFARRAYEEVYQEFCRILGVPNATIRANQTVFANMIGLIQGRIYYNLLNWYRVLAMLPGFQVNRGFMEQMMGVKESLPAEIVAKLERATFRQRLLDSLYLARTVGGLVLNYFQLERRKRRFYARLADALGEGRPDLSLLRADELAEYYRTLDGQLLHHWDAPLVNDFFAMIFYGLLRFLCGKWCGDDDGSLQNDLLAGGGRMISAEPAQRVRELADVARGTEKEHPGFVALLRGGTQWEIEQAMASILIFSRQYHAYLEKFGDRCLNELKLESATLYDDPLPLLRSVGQLAATEGDLPLQNGGEKADGIRQRAEERAASGLAGKPLRRMLFRWVLRNARDRVRDRENLRFERTRVFGRARQIFRGLGERFYEVDRLADPQDIFYLELGEILGFVDGTTTTTDLAGLVAVRKREFARFASGNGGMSSPAERFATYGMVHQGNTFRAPIKTTLATAAGSLDGDSMQGLGCCPGIVRGRVRVVTNPLAAKLEQGDIIVAEHTDPSWIMILPLAAGLLVARGSLLSHAAIVSRELGIPAVVSLAGVTEWLVDGDWVEFDGSTGMVRKLEMPTSDE